MTAHNLAALNLVAERTAEERDRAAAALRRAEELARHAALQGEQLDAYRAEYVQRWSRQFGKGGAIEIVQCYRSFMQRLDEAIAQQQRRIQGTRHAVDEARRALVEVEVRLASVRKLIERRRAELGREAHRREQRAADEIGQQLARRHARSGGLAVSH